MVESYLINVFLDTVPTDGLGFHDVPAVRALGRRHLLIKTKKV